MYDTLIEVDGAPGLFRNERTGSVFRPDATKMDAVPGSPGVFVNRETKAWFRVIFSKKNATDATKKAKMKTKPWSAVGRKVDPIMTEQKLHGPTLRWVAQKLKERAKKSKKDAAVRFRNDEGTVAFALDREASVFRSMAADLTREAERVETENTPT